MVCGFGVEGYKVGLQRAHGESGFGTYQFFTPPLLLLNIRGDSVVQSGFGFVDPRV